MPEPFDFISLSDQPALLAISTPEWHVMAKDALTELGYKVHSVETHQSFPIRFSQIHYHVVVIEDLFCAAQPEDNISLRYLQELPMAQRRHATVLLIGPGFQTLNPLQAFQQSVHAIVHSAELPVLGQLVRKVVAENNLFLQPFREIQQLARGQS
jgi:hypothetical protein